MASKQIKGLTVEIGGDTTKLGDALRSIDNKSVALSQDLKEINQLLKLDPTNTEMLTAKQKLLSEQIETTKKRLEVLTEAEQSAQKQLEKGDIGEDEFRALQMEIYKSQQRLSGLEKSYKKTESAAKDAGKGIQEAGDKSADAAKDTDTLKQQLDELKDKYSDVKEAGADIGKTIGSIAAIGGGAVGATIANAMRYEDALADIEAQTGADKREMQGFKKAMDAVFANNYGENLDDIASSMAAVVQVTRETDPSKLQELTENALTLRDTFGFEVTETLRSVKMLMDQFGLSSEEAFNLVVQGAQKGLNKNGDLLDIINEYSVHYQQMGYSAEEFFGSLQNGTAAGTFSVDKLGDAMKEFGIRTKDTAASTMEAYELLGYSSTDSIAKIEEEVADLEQKLQYATMEQANFTAKTSELTRLKNADKIAEYSKQLDIAQKRLNSAKNAASDSGKSIENLQAKFAAGGESAREATQEVLDALFSMEDEVARNQVGVALFGTMWEDLGESGIQALSDVNTSLSSTKDAMQRVKDVKYDTVSNDWKALGRTVQTELINPLGQKALPLAKKFINWTSIHMDELIPKVKVAAATFATMFVAQKIGVFLGSVVKLVKAYKDLKNAATIANLAMHNNVFGFVAGAIGAVVGFFGSLIAKEREAKRAQEELSQAYRDAAKAAEESRQSRIDAARNINGEYDSYHDLWKELQGLVDQNGKIIQGNEDRAKIICGILSEATGIEIELTDGVIQKYDDLAASIDNVIEKERGKALLSSMQGDYDQAKSDYSSKQETYEVANQEYNAQEEYIRQLEQNAVNAKEELARVQQTIDRLNNKTNWTADEDRIYRVATTRASELEGEIESLLDAENGTIKEAKDELARLNENLANAAYDYDTTASVIENYEKLQEAILNNDPQKLAESISDASNSLLHAETSVLSSLQTQQESAEAAYDKLTAYSKEVGTTVTEEQLKDALDLKISTMLETYKKMLLEGDNITDEELKEQHAKISTALEETGKYSQSEIAYILREIKRKGVQGGEDFAEGFAQGVESKTERVQKASDGMGRIAVASLNNSLLIKSPSRVARRSGGFFGEGFGLGIEDKTEFAVDRAVHMTQRVVHALNGDIPVPTTAYASTIAQFSAPEPNLTAKYADAAGMLERLDRIYSAVQRIDPRLVLDDGTLISRTVRKTDIALGRIIASNKRGRL